MLVPVHFWALACGGCQVGAYLARIQVGIDLFPGRKYAYCGEIIFKFAKKCTLGDIYQYSFDKT